MEDNSFEKEETEVVVNREPATASIRETLKQQLNNETNESDEHEPESDTQEEANNESVSNQVIPDVPPMAAPADMNAAERDAFFNPTPANAHILQQYLNRRAYETRTQYDRKMQEVNQLKQQTQALYDTYKEYENQYAKAGHSVVDVTKRAIAWDQLMKEDPVTTALDWLESYGLTPDDLVGQELEYPQGNYLTREEAERIAEERYQALQSEQEKKALELFNQQVVQSFMSSKPLFRDPETASQLEAEMAPVVQALTATGRYNSSQDVLETAYNYVVNGNPTFSALQQRIAAAPVVKQQQATVQKAKQAAKSITGSAGSGTPRIQIKDIRDNLARRFNGE